MKKDSAPEFYGLMAEFDSPDGVVEAAHRVREAGYREVDAYTPYPIEELNEVVVGHRSRLPLIVLAGGLAGMVGGFALQYWTAVVAYPLNVGGRPFNSWPAFIVPTFECTILAAALAAVVGMLALNKLPAPYHPVFNVPRFITASRDRYFLVVKTKDPRFDARATRDFLLGLKPVEVSDVEH